jgi:Flp pilus assembly protein TadG
MDAHGTQTSLGGARGRSRGQVLVIFAGAIFLFVALLALVVDVAWYWANSLKVQRAADAAALAGVVWLPSKPATAASVASTEATRNGYTAGSGVSFSAVQDTGNQNQLDVVLSAPVQTFFMRVFGISTINVTRTSEAVYVLPVPMGSPLNTFGYRTATNTDGSLTNFWAAIQGPGTAKENGDPYATKGMVDPPLPAGNNQYIAPSTGDPGPYNYAIDVPAGAAGSTIAVSLYDPEFCARASAQNDTGDTVNLYPGGGGSTIDTTFTLYDATTQPLNFAIAGSPLKQTMYPTSCSSTYVTGSGGNYTGKWISYYTITNAQAGIYRLNIGTCVTSAWCLMGNGSNSFSIKAVASGSTQPQVYGLGTMSIYANIPSGTTNLYMAQIPAIDAGKTMEIRMFDVGDVDADAYMEFLAPTSSAWTAQPFTWYDSDVGDTNVTIPYPLPNSSATMSDGKPGIVTTNGGSRPFNDHWLIVDIPIPPNYTAPQGGWWKLAYTYVGGAAHDRTTWKVTVIGNPVHLIVP